ncbi:unnamed protein product [Urochloa humidicola]
MPTPKRESRAGEPSRGAFRTKWNKPSSATGGPTAAAAGTTPLPRSARARTCCCRSALRAPDLSGGARSKRPGVWIPAPRQIGASTVGLIRDQEEGGGRRGSYPGRLRKSGPCCVQWRLRRCTVRLQASVVALCCGSALMRCVSGAVGGASVYGEDGGSGWGAGQGKSFRLLWLWVGIGGGE